MKDAAEIPAEKGLQRKRWAGRINAPTDGEENRRGEIERSGEGRTREEKGRISQTELRNTGIK